MKLPKRKRVRGNLTDYYAEISFREDIILRLIEEYGPDFATWSAAGNQMGDDALSWRSHMKKVMSRKANMEEKRREQK